MRDCYEERETSARFAQREVVLGNRQLTDSCIIRVNYFIPRRGSLQQCLRTVNDMKNIRSFQPCQQQQQN